jgi:hypothetical protein
MEVTLLIRRERLQIVVGGHGNTCSETGDGLGLGRILKSGNQKAVRPGYGTNLQACNG